MTEEFGTQLESGALRFARDLPGPIERVWSFLVDPEKRAQWFCGGTMGTAPGDRFVLDFDHDRISHEPVPDSYAELEGGIAMEAELLAIDPPRLLEFQWIDDARPVRIELEDRGDRVRMVLIQSPPDDFDELTGAAGGWQAHLGILADRLAGDTPRGFWSEHEQARRHYQRALRPV